MELFKLNAITQFKYILGRNNKNIQSPNGTNQNQEKETFSLVCKDIL